MIDDIMKDFRPHMSALTLATMVVAQNGGTPWGMYEQALLEINSRIEAGKAELAQVKCIREKASAATDAKSLKLQLQMQTILERHRTRLEELRHLIAMARALKSSLGEISEERRNQLDAEKVMYRLKCQAAAEVMQLGLPSPQTIQIIRCLPPKERATLALECLSEKTRTALVDWYCEHEVNIPDYTSFLLPEPEVRKLLE